MKKAILAVSFGTSYPDTLRKTIAATEQALAEAFPDWEVRRAFTSGMIIRKLKERDGVEIENVAQAMQRLEEEGFTHIAVQSTHVMHGEEYEKMLSQLEPYRLRMKVSVGMPLLHGEEDYAAVAQALLNNSAYAQMEHMLQSSCDRVYLATVEGYPTLESVERQLAKRPEIRRLMLAPFMLVAGDHARNDMSGDEDSWAEQLKKAGYPVRCILQGLGECPAIRALFVEHCRSAVEALATGGKLWGVRTI